MKITFKDNSYIDCQLSHTPNKIIITICAKDAQDPLKSTTNAVEISVEDFKKLISDV